MYARCILQLRRLGESERELLHELTYRKTLTRGRCFVQVEINSDGQQWIGNVSKRNCARLSIASCIRIRVIQIPQNGHHDNTLWDISL